MNPHAWQRAGSRATIALLATLSARLARRAGACEARLELARNELEQARAERERLSGELRRQRSVLQRVEQSRRAEREWNRELRTQLQRLYDSPRRAPEREDVTGLILRAAIQLVGAEKGMLLSREDADGDGALDVTVAEGFEHDPGRSVVAQRFARWVLALDEIVREDTPTEGIDELTPADEEIDALVAIPVYVYDRFRGVIVCVNRPGGFEEVEDDVLLALGDQAGAVLHQGHLRAELREAHHGAIRALLEALAARNPERHRHSTALTLHAARLARGLGFDEWDQDVLVCAALLRDAGWLALPDGVLAEPRPLRPDERAAIELHPRFGFKVIGQMPALRDVAATVLYHHERFDGCGYPNGLAGESIPRTARALAVLEAYDAMTSERPYRSALSSEEACTELVAQAGGQFDPEIAQLFVEQVRRREAVRAEQVEQTVADAQPHDVLEELDGFAGPLTVTSTDGLTLLRNRRALEQDLLNAAGTTPVELLLVQIEDLPRVNEELGYEAGDHLIQVAARNTQRAAARCGGRAYRASGRRLAVVAAPDGSGSADDPGVLLEAEFVAGPVIRIARCVVEPGERAAEVLDRVRERLMEGDRGG